MTKDVQDRMVAVARVRDAFHRAVYEDADVDAACALLTEDSTIEHLPSGSGGAGRDEIRRHLADDVIAHLPADLEFGRLSRTGDRWRVVVEETVAFTHDRELPWLLPGVAPTGRRAEVLAVSIVTVPRGGLVISSHRTLWDQDALRSVLGVAAAATGR